MEIEILCMSRLKLRLLLLPNDDAARPKMANKHDGV